MHDLERIRSVSKTAGEATKLYGLLPDRGRKVYIGGLTFLVGAQDLLFGGISIRYPTAKTLLEALDTFTEENPDGLVKPFVRSLYQYGVTTPTGYLGSVRRGFVDAVDMLTYNVEDVKTIHRIQARHHKGITYSSEGRTFHSKDTQPPSTTVTGLLMSGDRLTRFKP